MQRIIEFYSNLSVSPDKVVQGYGNVSIEKEPMFYRADLDFVQSNMGWIHRNFINRLRKDGWLKDGEKVIFDSRVHMLMRGWYPCIPGWHHDDVPRTRPDGQPDYFNKTYFAQHAMMLLNAKLSPTQFLIGEFQLPEPEQNKVIYQEWDRRIELLLRLDPKAYERVSAPGNRVIYFDARTLHQGTPATGDGWRLFIRASKNTDVEPANKIRRNANVYLPAPFAGW